MANSETLNPRKTICHFMPRLFFFQSVAIWLEGDFNTAVLSWTYMALCTVDKTHIIERVIFCVFADGHFWDESVWALIQVQLYGQHAVVYSILFGSFTIWTICVSQDSIWDMLTF